jgi:hypothetical protein
MQIDVLSKNDSRVALGCLWTLAVLFSMIAFMWVPARDENGVLAYATQRAALGVLLIVILLIAPTHRRATTLKLDTSILCVTDYLLWIVPI